MKHRYSDLLDGVSAEDVTLKKMPLVSSRRIREKTFEQLGVSKKKRKLSVMSRVAVVAAVFASLMITACAADTVFNDGAFFGGFFGNDLSENQIDTLNTIGKTFDQEDKLTSNGAVLTPISVVTDGRICYLHIRLQAPEGVVLQDLPEDKTYSFTGKENKREEMEVVFDFERHTLSKVKVNALPDSNPSDNVKEFVLEFYASWTSGFNGNTVRIRIPGLWVRGLPDTNSKYHYSKLFSADFEFDITVNRVDQRIDLKDLGVTHYIEKHDFSVNLEQIIITPLRMEVYYTATLPENEDILPDGGYAQLVMKDGKKLTLGDVSDVSDGPDVGYRVLSKFAAYYGYDAEKFAQTVAREAHCDTSVRYVFDEPVVLEDIDYIVWCGGQIIDLN